MTGTIALILMTAAVIALGIATILTHLPGTNTAW